MNGDHAQRSEPDFRTDRVALRLDEIIEQVEHVLEQLKQIVNQYPAEGTDS